MPATVTELPSSSNAALTPLCLDMGSLQLSATPASQAPAAVTPASTAHGNDGSATPVQESAFGLPVELCPEGETPAFARTRTGWNRSVLDAPGGKSCTSHLHASTLV